MAASPIKRQDRCPASPVAPVLLLIGLLLGASAQAQALRIGYVDMKRLLESAPQVVNARDSLDREFSPRNESLLAEEAQLDSMRSELAEAADLTPEQRFEREREIRNLQRSIERRREDLNEELRFRLNERKNALEDTIEVAVRQIAESGGYDLILTSPVAYASDSIDITDRVLEWLEDDFDSQQDQEPRPSQ
ncbi:MAG: hypothetical protein GVY32_12910 [Gammaproteobacteria bacterium]|jgi:outer membrane protein|nr:hypothetical protein [Gammaproteobacteria bacterium]